MSAFSPFDTTVNSVYLAFYGRPADPAGLAFWSKQLADNNGDLGAIIGFFANSEEAQVRFGTDTLSSRIGEIYTQLFNHAPDAAGLAYWSNAVEQGNASLADVSIAILKGAQGSDQTLANLRQQAADAFTAAVAASGTEYNGYASIEAARVLVRAVTAGATAADLDALVKAAVSFADTATKTPRVIDAIASGSTLLGLFDTTRGLADPVALAQALADTAKAAAGDPVTLASLLRGGGMAQVLKVMPASATLKDVVKALADGGLPAAIEVVYPSAPSTPVTNLKLAFASVTQGEGDSQVDHVTREHQVDVKFTYTGNDLRGSQSFEYSVDGVHWSRDNLTVNTATNTVTIADVWLGGFTILGDMPAPDLTTTFVLRAVTASGAVISSATQDLVYDSSAPAGALSFVRIDDGDVGNNTTGDEQVGVTFALDGDDGDSLVQWRIKGDEAWTTFSGKSSFTIDVDLSESDVALEVRLIDAAGNVGDTIEQFIDGPNGTSPTFDINALDIGLILRSDTAGTLSMYDLDQKTSTPLKDVDGSSALVADTYTVIGAQDTALTGFVQFTTQNGQVLTPVPVEITLGSNGGETMSGNVVWGFGGNDTITGTDDLDSLFGGDGNDTINGGLGADWIMGGLGGDLIDLGDDEDSDRVSYPDGDSVTGVFVDGGSALGIDKITSLKDGDVISTGGYFGAVPVVQTTYLDDTDSNALAVVRGVSANGTFTAGSGQDADDYMVQWVDDNDDINSFIVKDYGVNRPLVQFSQNGGEFGFIKPSAYAGATFALSDANSRATILAVGDTVTGLHDASGFVLNVDDIGMTEAPYYTSVPVFSMQGDTLQFNGSLAAGLYQMVWTGETFTTQSGYLAAGEQYFAGGQNGSFYHSGFSIEEVIELPLNEPADASLVINTAYLSQMINARVNTGAGNDVVVNDSRTVTVVYTSLEAGSEDLILDFDAGQDKISFEGAAAIAIDRDGSGTIGWASSASEINGGDEGVRVVTQGFLQLGTGDESFSLATLNGSLDVTAIAKNDGLLILASNDTNDAGVLFFYQRLDDDTIIDADELTEIAMFSDGLPETVDIVVVGVGIP